MHAPLLEIVFRYCAFTRLSMACPGSQCARPRVSLVKRGGGGKHAAAVVGATQKSEQVSKEGEKRGLRGRKSPLALVATVGLRWPKPPFQVGLFCVTRAAQRRGGEVRESSLSKKKIKKRKKLQVASPASSPASNFQFQEGAVRLNVHIPALDKFVSGCCGERAQATWRFHSTVTPRWKRANIQRLRNCFVFGLLSLMRVDLISCTYA